MHDIALKRDAQRLRSSGQSITSIAEKLKLNKTTISYWCRDIILSEDQIQRNEITRMNNSLVALLKYSENKRKSRMQRSIFEKREGIKIFDLNTRHQMLALGLGLYWGEGYKESNGEMGFTNSNPKIIRFYLKWLKLLGVHIEDLIFRLSLNEVFRKYEAPLVSFWCKYLLISQGQFSKTTFIKTKLKKADESKMHNYKGILRVKVRKGLSLKNKILGAIQNVADQP